MADPGVEAITTYFRSQGVFAVRVRRLWWGGEKLRQAGLGPGARAYLARKHDARDPRRSLLLAYGPECGWIFAKQRLKLLQDDGWTDSAL
jgi:hypothetical protein